MCLASTENMVKWKINYTLTVKTPTSVVKPMQPSFYLQMISRRERERERERENRWPPSQASTAQTCCPYCPDRAGQASSFFSLLPQLFFSLLLNVADLAATDHRPLDHYTSPPNPPSVLVSFLHCLSPV